MIEEVDRVLYRLGYFDADPIKKAEVQGYIEEAEEFMRAAGVSDEKMTSQRAYAVKSLWADYRDKGDDNNIIKKDGMIVALIAQLKG